MADRTVLTVYRGGPGQVIGRLDRLLPIPPVDSGVDVGDPDESESYAVRSTVLAIEPDGVTLYINLR